MILAFAVAPVVLVTLLIGLRGVAAMRTTSDFLVASRRVSPLLNSAAVSGEYLSAASFLGVAGLVVKDGIGSLWYPVGFTAGYIAMLVLVAAPMRRSGALTVPDFAEARLNSPALRRVTAGVILVIGGLYLVPQFRTAGLVLSAVTRSPYWVGVVIAGAGVPITLALGGMRAATYVQAFQFALKLVLFIVPAIWLLVQVTPQTRYDAVNPTEFTRFTKDTSIEFTIGTTLELKEPFHGRTGRWEVPQGTTVTFPKGSKVPQVSGEARPGGDGWSRPLLDLANAGHPLLGTWALVVALALGTMGLPHVIMRFHTSPDGRAARRTAAFTVGLLGIFYLFPGIYGVLGRVLVPQLYLNGATDTAVVALPAQVDHGWPGSMFTALLTGGAFAAFLATSLGLLLVVSGAISYDLLPGRRGGRTPCAASDPARRGHPRDLGVHGRRLHVLPAARARHLVVTPHGRRRDVRRARRSGHVVGRHRRHAGRRSGDGLARHPGRPTSAMVGPAGVPHDGRRVTPRQARLVGAHRDASPAPQRGARTDPRRPAAHAPRTRPDQPRLSPPPTVVRSSA